MTFAQTLRLYADRRMAKILFIGFISGFPWVLIGSMLTLWLKDEELSRTGIGFFGLVFGVYAINALWAPIIDGFRVPFLSRRFGRRKAWIILMQIVIAAAMLCLFSLPSAKEHLWWVSLYVFIIACASATQDIAIDAMRIEIIRQNEPEKVGAGSAMATSGWWIGFGGSKVIILPMVGWLQAQGVENAWQIGYLTLIPIIALSILGVVLFVDGASEKDSGEDDDTPQEKQQLLDILAREGGNASQETGLNFFERMIAVYARPILSFVNRYSLNFGLALILFIFFFKIGEAFLGKMAVIFYKEVGFKTSEIGLVSGGLGTLTACTFAIIGSFFNARYGLFRGIILGGIAMASTNLLFAALAVYPEKWLFAVAVVADQFTTAVSTVALVAFISQLCDRRYTATQYAALGSVGNLSRTLLAAFSGALVDALGGNWVIFFFLTVVAVCPSLFILFAIRKPIGHILSGATTKVI